MLAPLLHVSLVAGLTGTPVGQAAYQSYSLPLAAPPEGLVVAELNTDGAPDLAVTLRTDVFELELHTFRGVGNGDLQAAYVVPLLTVYGTRARITPVQLGGDELIDLAIVDSFPGLLPGTGFLDLQGSASIPTYGGDPFSVDFADIDGDGDLDSTLLVNDLGGLYVDLGLNDGLGNLSDASFAFAPGPNHFSPFHRLVDNDGNGLPSVYLTSSAGLYRNAWPDGAETNETLLAGDFGDFDSADLNGDGLPDLVLLEPTQGNVLVLLAQADGQYGAPVRFQSGRAPHALQLLDVNGDGATDVAIANRDSDDVSIFTNDGTGQLTLAFKLPVGDGPIDLALIDLDLDGDLDLVTANENSPSLTVLLQG